MLKIALAGQPNCGKSTIFTMMSGVKQYVANYPGVTVEKKSTFFEHRGVQVELVDLPGTYSFSPYSKEEQATINFLLDEDPDIIINVIDASSLQRSLYFTYQLLELGKPVIIAMNMMDVVKRRGIQMDLQGLAQTLGVRIVETVGSRGVGKAEMLDAIEAAGQRVSAAKAHQAQDAVQASVAEADGGAQAAQGPEAAEAEGAQAASSAIQNYIIAYPKLEEAVERLQAVIAAHIESTIAPRWLALKLLEQNTVVDEKLRQTVPEMMAQIDEMMPSLVQELGDLEVDAYIASTRHHDAKALFDRYVEVPKQRRQTVTSYIDKLVLNPWLAFIALALVIYGTYEISIVRGYQITNYTWPYLAAGRNFIYSLLPAPSFVDVPLITEFVMWMVNSALALLNYVPIFLILFAIIAILEDTGYMPRIAFVLDRVFSRYGLHGHSTLPLVLGGAFVGGCAVPGIMATKGISDDRARVATVMTVPYMNCLAKVPFYTLLLGAFFPSTMSIMMFFISTVTFFIALSVAGVLTSSVLRRMDTKPFVMELPPYHLPTIKGVGLRAVQRVWQYIQKVGTIVMAVAVVLFVLLQFPGISDESQARIDARVESLLQDFDEAVKDSPYYAQINDRETIYTLLYLNDRFRSERMTAASSADKVAALEARYQEQYPEYFGFLRPSNPDERAVNRQLRSLGQQGQLLQNEIKNERIENSFLGMFGRFLEPVTQWAGFDWRINVSFLSSFAARESAVATIGSIYESGMSERPEEAMASDEYGYNALHAMSMLIFMIFTPPCIASMVVLKLNVRSYSLMMLAIAMPFMLGLVFASVFFTLGGVMGWSGLQAMAAFYFTVIGVTILLGLRRRQVVDDALIPATASTVGHGRS